MMASRLLKAEHNPNFLVRAIDRGFGPRTAQDELDDELADMKMRGVTAELRDMAISGHEALTTSSR